MSTTTAGAISAENRGDDKTIYKLLFYVPPAHTQQCLTAIFTTGAGSWPDPDADDTPSDGAAGASEAKYTETCFISGGTGQFRPSTAASPHIGRRGELEHVEEERVEMVVVGTRTVRAAVEALRAAHPYEVPAYFVVRCENF